MKQKKKQKDMAPPLDFHGAVTAGDPLPSKDSLVESYRRIAAKPESGVQRCLELRVGYDDEKKSDRMVCFAIEKADIATMGGAIRISIPTENFDRVGVVAALKFLQNLVTELWPKLVEFPVMLTTYANSVAGKEATDPKPESDDDPNTWRMARYVRAIEAFKSAAALGALKYVTLAGLESIVTRFGGKNMGDALAVAKHSVALIEAEISKEAEKARRP